DRVVLVGLLTTAAFGLPRQAFDNTPIVQISAGDSDTCARAGNQWMWCWGDNTHGQLGDGSNIDRHAAMINAASSIVTEVSADGGGHVCIRKTALSTLACSGWNGYGELGDGTTMERNVPTPVAGLGPGTQIVTGAQHTCAIKPDQSLSCWGRNDDGEL